MENNDKLLTFYTLPFADDGSCGYIYDDKDNFAFMIAPILTDAQVDKIIVSINSETYKPLIYKQPIKLEYIKEVKVINMNGKPFIVIRGWGNLTGKSACNLSDEKANEIQDNLANWLISKLQ